MQPDEAPPFSFKNTRTRKHQSSMPCLVCNIAKWGVDMWIHFRRSDGKTERKGLACDSRTSEIGFFLPSSSEKPAGPRQKKKRPLGCWRARCEMQKSGGEEGGRERGKKKQAVSVSSTRVFWFQGLFCSKGITMQSRDGIKKEMEKKKSGRGFEI